MQEHRHDHARTADLSALYERVAQRLGVPQASRSGKGSGFTAAEIARQLKWLDQAERAERQLGRDGSWAHDPNRLLALRQARDLARALARKQACELTRDPECEPSRRPAFSPSRESFPPAHGGQAR
ncbi:hypothetical protein [Stappia sp.]|uniref:hypothetical protein n=1 Tax=Stappia sp. TaxID=1870903 RepID=UPI003D0EFE9A